MADFEEITQSNAVAVWNRFQHFHDSLIRKVTFSNETSNVRSVAVVIAVRDAQQTQQNGWSTVTLAVSGVSNFSYSGRDRYDSMVMSPNGLHLCWLGESVALEFGDFTDPPATVAELLKSERYFQGQRLQYLVSAYEE